MPTLLHWYTHNSSHNGRVPVTPFTKTCTHPLCTDHHCDRPRPSVAFLRIAGLFDQSWLGSNQQQLPFLKAHSIVSYVKTFLVLLLHSALSNATMQNCNCFILLERHYLETISFVIKYFVVHEKRLNLCVVFPLRG